VVGTRLLTSQHLLNHLIFELATTKPAPEKHKGATKIDTRSNQEEAFSHTSDKSYEVSGPSVSR